MKINYFYCLTEITSLSAAIGKQLSIEKHFPSPTSADDIFGDAGIISDFKLEVSLFSFELMNTSRLSKDD